MNLLLKLLNLFSRATTAVLEVFFPQIVINKKWPQERYIEEVEVKQRWRGKKSKVKPKKQLVRRWRWIHSPMVPVQFHYVNEHFWEYWLRWFISWPFITAAASKLPKEWAGGVLLMWLFAAIWTFTGLLKARAMAQKDLKELAKQNNKMEA